MLQQYTGNMHKFKYIFKHSKLEKRAKDQTARRERSYNHIIEEKVYLLKLLLILFPVALLHVPFLGFGTAECDEALETLQIFMLVWEDRRKKGKSFSCCHQ